MKYYLLCENGDIFDIKSYFHNKNKGLWPFIGTLNSSKITNNKILPSIGILTKIKSEWEYDRLNMENDRDDENFKFGSSIKIYE